MKKLVATLVLGLFFVTFSNAQNTPPAKTTVSTEVKAEIVKSDTYTTQNDKLAKVETDATQSKKSCVGKSKASCAGKSKASCAGKSKASCDGKTMKVNHDKVEEKSEMNNKM